MDWNKPRRRHENKKHIRRVKDTPEYYLLLSDENKKSLFLATLMISKRPELFPFVHEEVKKNKESVKSLIKENWQVYRYFSKDLKSEPEILNYFLEFAQFGEMQTKLQSQKYDAFKNLSKRINSTNETNLNIFHYYFGKHFEFSKNQALLILSHSRNHNRDSYRDFFEALPESWKEKKGFLRSLVEKNFVYYRYLKPKYQFDVDIVIAAHKSSNGLAFKDFPEELRADAYFVLEMNKIKPVSKKYLAGEIKELFKGGTPIDALEKVLMYQQITKSIGLNDSNPIKKRKI